MKKHDLISLALLTTAIAGAGLVYFEMVLIGQIVYLLATMFSSLTAKAKAAPLQAWIALIIWSGFGYVAGDWMISVAVGLAFFSIAFRNFMLRTGTYTTVTWQEPVIGTIALGIYVAANLIHDNGWQGWAFPAAPILMGFAFGYMGYADRKNVRNLINNGLIEIGTNAPDFSLMSHEGKEVSLGQFKGVRDMLLIFVRGDWCPSCHIMLRTYEKQRAKFQDKNIMLFAIGPDPVGVNKAMVEKLGVQFEVLSDENLDVSKKYCVQIQEEASGSGMTNGVPLPASFLIDKQGIVRYTSRANNAGEFFRPEVIFDVLAKI